MLRYKSIDEVRAFVRGGCVEDAEREAVVGLDAYGHVVIAECYAISARCIATAERATERAKHAMQAMRHYGMSRVVDPHFPWVKEWLLLKQATDCCCRKLVCSKHTMRVSDLKLERLAGWLP